MSTYLKNAWYVAAWSDEIGRQLFRRLIMNDPILLYRKEDGSAVAMSNRCAHRFAPLHLGKLEGDAVSCPYHGLRYNSSGHCILNPNGNQRVPTGARLKVYPTIERYGAVWIWPGDPDQADSGLIPNLSFMEDHVSYAPVTGAMHVRANYRLIIDNLVDSAHVSTVHHDTLACESFLRATADVKVEGNTIWANLNCPPGMPSPIWRQLWEAEYGPVPGPMDHWATAGWTPASIIIQETGVTPRRIEISGR